ncbi:MAG: ATP-grasp domain-containing protein [Sneathiellales bacterium]|nr:ATP-grasp domain-containing protein [Sneathiellales bacterium]
MIKTLLIANRGEIARRIIRTAQNLGIETVAVYTETDTNTPHMQAADIAVLLEDQPDRGEPYLDIERLIEIAKAHNVDAIHPGYGFLSENPDFAKACEDASIIFVGPTADAISLMADKAEGKIRMQNVNVPCVPGYDGEDQRDDILRTEAEKIGTPLLIKAVAGGGGRGMRRVDKLDQFDEALASARSEAKNAFGSDVVILEKYLVQTRHIEIQVFADTHGNVVHLFERDCSTQRRHQKVIEEAPSPFVDPDLRDALGKAAVTAAAAINYRGAGTVEFLVTPEKEFYFIEMNTRLQVEHPVTEEITGLDLVEWQLKIAAGEPLPLNQEEIQLNGASMEVRLYAENPEDNFMPQTGSVLEWYHPEGPGIRIDHMIAEGNFISARYDPMIAKIIVSGKNREAARKKLTSTLRQLRLKGLLTNRSFLLSCLDHSSFIEGPDTGFVDTLLSETDQSQSVLFETFAAAVLYFQECRKFRTSIEDWSSLGIATRRFAVLFGEEERHFSISARDTSVEISHPEKEGTMTVNLVMSEDEITALKVGNDTYPLCFWPTEDGTLFDFSDGFLIADRKDPNPENAGPAEADHIITAPMAGRILAIETSAGAETQSGDTVIILEAMKMEHRIRTNRDGIIEKINIAVGDQVNKNDRLLQLQA